MRKRIVSFIVLVVLIVTLLPSSFVYASQAGMTPSVQLGWNNSMLLKGDKTLWGWGANWSGKLGIGTMSNKNQPIKILDDVVSFCVSKGGSNGAAIKADKTLWIWGDNGCGQLGNGTYKDSSVPVKIMDDVISVSLGENHAAAIKTDGSLWTWGDNGYGQLGDGTTNEHITPVKIMSNVASISLGYNHSAAIKVDGSLYTWGSNQDGGLGDGQSSNMDILNSFSSGEHVTHNMYLPHKIMDNVKAVSLGRWYGAAIKADGSLWTWGDNDCGQLGNGTYESSSIPIKIMDGVKSVALGAFHSAIIKTDNSLWLWGSNYDKIMSIAGCKDSYQCIPLKVMDNVFNVSFNGHCSVIKRDGSLWIWGCNDYGQIGNGTYSNNYIPLKLMDDVILPEQLEHITVLINGKIRLFNQPPIVIGGRTLVPLRAIFEAMGATVNWDNNTQTVTSTLDSTTIQLTIGSNVLHKNGTAVTLDVPAQLINGYTMVPVRAIAEAFGADVDWDGDTQTVYITTKGNTYTVNTIPQITYDGYNANFADFNGMYIDSFTHSTNNNGSENVKFDVYNTAYIYGIVEVYDQNDNLTDVAIIDKMSNDSSIKGVLIDNTGRLIKDLWNGTALTYRQESGYSKKTSINIDIPKNGYIKITNDMNDSLVASVINLSDIVFGANKTFSTLNGFNSNTSKEYVSALSAKIIKEAAFAEMIKNPTKYTEKLWKGVVKELYMNPESVGGFLDTVSKNLDEFADGELSKLMLSTATNCGIGIAEGTFEALAGPAGVALKAMFAITSVTDILIEMNDGLDCLYQGSINISAN